MVDQWNPAAPMLVGLEFGAQQSHRKPREFVASASEGLVWKASLNAVEADLISPVVVLEPRRRDPDEPMPLLALDCYRWEGEAYRFDEPEWERLSPSGSGFTGEVEIVGASASIHEALSSEVDDAVDLIAPPLDSPGAFYLGFTPVDAVAGRRIRLVRCTVRLSRQPGATNLSSAGYVNVILGGLAVSTPTVLDQIHPRAHDIEPDAYHVTLGEQFPSDDRETHRGLWSPASVGAFADETELNIVVATSGIDVRVLDVTLEILHTTEDRLWALGIDASPAMKKGPAWYEALPVEGIGGATYDKDARHVWVLRGARRAGGGVTSATVPILSGDGPVVMGDSPVSRVLRRGQVLPLEDEKPQQQMAGGVPRAIGFLHRADVDDAGSGEDSYAYADVRRVKIRNASTTQVIQPLGATATANYVLASLVVSAEQEPSNNLRLRIRRVVDDVVMATVIITPADWTAGEDVGTGRLWRRVFVDIDPAVALVAGTEYVLIVDSTTADPETPWAVQILRSVPVATGVDMPDPADGTYAKGLAASVGGTPDPRDGDLSGWISIRPPSVADLTVTSGEQAIDSRGLERISCDLTGIPYAHLEWTPAASDAYDALFRYYEIQRRDPPDGEWATVAKLTDLEAEQWKDYEARIGVEVDYRIRIVRAVTARSPWETESGTVDPSGTGYTLTSNERPALNLGYVDLANTNEGREFVNLDAQGVEYREMMGRDFAVRFGPLERRGKAFTRTMLIAALAPADRSDLVLDDLEELADRTTLPYVCVRDEHGGRWFCGLTIGNSRIVGGAQITTAEVSFREVAGESEAVVVE